ncbi:hypothetical protein TNCV_1785671 [Trichonephila clavipes]|nr:hypothetical protein TNCV_1785671 [Trichonephila clavipes]
MKQHGVILNLGQVTRTIPEQLPTYNMSCLRPYSPPVRGQKPEFRRKRYSPSCVGQRTAPSPPGPSGGDAIATASKRGLDTASDLIFVAPSC